MSLRSTALVPVTDDHVDALYRWACDPRSGFRWRFGGGTPSPSAFKEILWGGVLCQFLVVDEYERLQGLVACYRADHANGHAYVAVQSASGHDSGVAAMAGTILLVDHVFRHWPFRKLYAEIPEYNANQFTGTLRRHLKTEGCLQSYVFYDGQYWDLNITSFDRHHWDTELRPRFAALAGLAKPETLPQIGM